MSLIHDLVPVSTGDVDEPAANTDAVVTYAASVGKQHVITGLAWSYDALPTGGSIKVENGSGNVVFALSITSKGPGFFIFPKPKSGTAGAAMIITLADGGAGVTGKLSILNHWTN